MNDNPQRNTAASANFAGLQYSDSAKSLINTNGEEKRLRAKSLAVFLYLAERKDTVVSKEEILSAVWPNTSASEESLTKSISEIRRTLNDNQHKTLRTLHRQGYMLVSDSAPAPEIQGKADAPAQSTNTLSRLWWLTLTIIPLALLAVFYISKNNSEAPATKSRPL